VSFFRHWLLINLLSAYLKPHLDQYFARFSSARATTISRRKAERERRVEALIASPEERQLHIADEFRCRLRSITLYVTSLSMLVLALSPEIARAGVGFRLSIYIASLFIYSFGLLNHKAAIDRRLLLSRALFKGTKSS
jgi:hypothetical protein